MKKVILGLLLIALTTAIGISLYSCSSETMPVEEINENLTDTSIDGEKLYAYFQNLSLSSIEEAIEQAESMEVEAFSMISRSGGQVEISDAVYDVIEGYNELNFDSNDDYLSIKNKLISVIALYEDELTITEYNGLLESVDIAILAMQYAVQLQDEPTTRSIGDSIWSAVKCVAGTAGSAGLGFLAGAGVGTVTLPVIGTVSGGALGGWSGALVGVASFC